MSSLTEFEKSDFSKDYRFRALISKSPVGDTVLDIGSGHGEIATAAKEKYRHIILGDNDEALVATLQKRFAGRSDVDVRLIDAQDFILESQVDVVCMCDILEHLPNPELALSNVFRSLKNGGILFVSVPAIPWLYGVRDKTYGHMRRYTKKKLYEEVISHGFEIMYVRYWNILGVLPYFVSEKVLGRSLVGPSRAPKGVLSRVVNTLLYLWLRVEHYIPWPIGLSVILIARKT